jgi:hypothetical protein
VDVHNERQFIIKVAETLNLNDKVSAKREENDGDVLKKNCWRPRLPDGMYSNQKSQFWVNFEGLGMEKVVIFFGRLEYFMTSLNIL